MKEAVGAPQSSPSPAFAGIIRFGNFDVDTRAGELRRSGIKLKLSGQPFDALVALLEKPGQVVMREELHDKLWSQHTFVDFEHGLNKAINKLREVLGDDADNPRFVETLPRHGYRFIAPVVDVSPAPPIAVAAQPQADAPASLIGKQISHYRILSELGSGGMGVVYQAEDTRLGRRVALKFLPQKLACDPKALKRFEREARAASSLNHPNICTIYEVEEHNHQPVIVMESLEGRSLKQRISEGPIPVEELLDFGIQTSDALESAHAKGIVHRDIKPANLFIVGDGRMKILDFGVAKVCDPPVANDLPEEESLTLDGSIPGTTSYMSPEQVRGEEVDARSDLFSLGVVLYEMATGQKPFIGKNRVLLMNAILNAHPAFPITQVSSCLPEALETIIARALEKKREKRFQHAAEICSDLKRLKGEMENASRAVPIAAPVKPDARPAGRLFTRYLAREFAAVRDRFTEKPVKQVETRPTNLPVQRTAFVGRKKEVAALKELLVRQDVRLVTVTGPGGIGKTRLAVQAASELVEHFPDGTHFVALASLSDPSSIASVIVQTLGIREAGGHSAIEILRKNLQDASRAPMLLLLDNFEHLIQAAPSVADLLATAPNLKIMVTSQAALHLYGEHEFPVPPLALPDSRSKASVEVLSQCPAVALFVQRAVAAKPDFELNRGNAAAVSEICARLDGLPLAIELAAARVKVLSPSLMLTRLANRLQLLTGGARDLPQRQQTLRATMDWSYDLLSAAEKKLFRRLSVFAGGCNLEGVEAVCDTKGDLDLNLLDGMASMLDKSLVQQIDHANGESRFVMLGTIREYGLEKLEASGELPLTKRAHAAYCLVLAEEEATEEGEKWLERFGFEHDNFRAGLEWLTETGDAEWGLRLGTALFRFWEVRESLAEGRDSLDKLLKLAGAQAPTKARARALLAAGVLAGGQGDYSSADALIGESQDIARRLGDKTGVAVSLNALAVVAVNRGDVAVARTLFEESLALWRELGDQKAVARALSNLASVVKLQGDYDHALSLHSECLSIFRELGDLRGVAWSLNYQGDLERDRGDSTAAQTLYEQGLAMFRELGDRWGIAGTLADLGSLARDKGNYSNARSLYAESIKLFRELDHKRGIARVLECSACSAAAQLEGERSLRLAGAAAALRQNIGAPLTPAEQAKLESALKPARQGLTNTVAATAWLEGSVLPVDKVIEEVLMP
jgi:predicted ATPase/DNA-binding winged helix-turn-helix (wHTH) protein